MATYDATGWGLLALMVLAWATLAVCTVGARLNTRNPGAPQ